MNAQPKAAEAEGKKVDMQKLLNDLLSRCDTIHDFTGHRATSVMDQSFSVEDVYGALDSHEDLKGKSIMARWRAEMNNATKEADLTKILRKSTNAFSFLQAYQLNEEKHVGYEPSIVQFFEHYYPDGVDPFYLLDSTEMYKSLFVDYTKPVDERRKISEISSKIAVLNLGNREKDLAADSSVDKREATGIYLSDQNKADAQKDLHAFFKGEGKDTVRFVVDASTVDLSLFQSEMMEIVSSVSSDWDAADKYSGATHVSSELKLTQTNNGFERILFQIDNLNLTKTQDNMNVSIVSNGKTVNVETGNVIREVGNIVYCLKDKECGKNDEPLYTNDKQKSLFYFDIKRSGDACQVLDIKTMNDSTNTNSTYKYVLVTNDHLAFLKARLNNVPVVFTKYSQVQNSKLLFCINNEVKDPKMHNDIMLEAIKKEDTQIQTVIQSMSQAQLMPVQLMWRCLNTFEGIKTELIKYMTESPPSPNPYNYTSKFDEDFAREFPTPARISQDKDNKLYELDLMLVKNKVTAYIVDYILCVVDLQCRITALNSLLERFQKISDRIKISAERDWENESVRQSEYESILKVLNTIRSLGYGAGLYSVFLEPGAVKMFEEYAETVTNSLKNRIYDTKNATDSSGGVFNILSFAMDKHFFLTNPKKGVDPDNWKNINKILNFTPIKKNTDVYKFLRKHYLLLVGTPFIQRTRGSTNITDNRSKFAIHVDNFLNKIKYAQKPGEPSDAVVARANKALEYVASRDIMIKSILFEDYAQNFKWRFASIVQYEQIGGEPRSATAAVQNNGNKKRAAYREPSGLLGRLGAFLKTTPPLATVGNNIQTPSTPGAVQSDNDISFTMGFPGRNPKKPLSRLEMRKEAKRSSEDTASSQVQPSTPSPHGEPTVAPGESSSGQTTPVSGPTRPKVNAYSSLLYQPGKLPELQVWTAGEDQSLSSFKEHELCDEFDRALYDYMRGVAQNDEFYNYCINELLGSISSPLVTRVLTDLQRMARDKSEAKKLMQYIDSIAGPAPSGSKLTTAPATSNLSTSGSLPMEISQASLWGGGGGSLSSIDVDLFNKWVIVSILLVVIVTASIGGHNYIHRTTTQDSGMLSVHILNMYLKLVAIDLVLLSMIVLVIEKM